jgi:hypothetical protein
MERVDYRQMQLASVMEAQLVAERVYAKRVGKPFERPAVKATAKKAKVTDEGKRSKLLAEMSKRTGVPVLAPEGDRTFDMATDSADDRSTLSVE